MNISEKSQRHSLPNSELEIPLKAKSFFRETKGVEIFILGPFFGPFGYLLIKKL